MFQVDPESYNNLIHTLSLAWSLFHTTWIMLPSSANYDLVSSSCLHLVSTGFYWSKCSLPRINLDKQWVQPTQQGQIALKLLHNFSLDKIWKDVESITPCLCGQLCQGGMNTKQSTSEWKNPDLVPHFYQCNINIFFVWEIQVSLIH